MGLNWLDFDWPEKLEASVRQISPKTWAAGERWTPRPWHPYHLAQCIVQLSLNVHSALIGSGTPANTQTQGCPCSL